MVQLLGMPIVHLHDTTEERHYDIHPVEHLFGFPVIRKSIHST
jgi:hypothetical protein